MADTGYSRKPLPAKLGIKPGHTVVVVGAPPQFALAGMDSSTEVLSRDVGAEIPGEVHGALDVVLVFCRDRATLEREFPRISPAIVDRGAFWVARPKLSSGVPTDLTEDAVREVVLPTGWVDVLVCAIDQTWSGLKIVRRLPAQPRTGHHGG